MPTGLPGKLEVYLHNGAIVHDAEDVEITSRNRDGGLAAMEWKHAGDRRLLYLDPKEVSAVVYVGPLPTPQDLLDGARPAASDGEVPARANGHTHPGRCVTSEGSYFCKGPEEGGD